MDVWIFALVVTMVAMAGVLVLWRRMDSLRAKVVTLTVEHAAHAIRLEHVEATADAIGADVRRDIKALSQMAIVQTEGHSRLAQGPHDHVFGSTPFDSDQFSETYKCQVPYCDRVQTRKR